jgi:demethylmenaquinone methyltransferase/2-methoxy-6-polyprenyl-1,4-benzoquinol methylase
MIQPAATPDNKNHHDMAAMFNSIAATYDKINLFSSFGLDRCWRQRLVRRLGKSGTKQVLDIACGTGALTWVIYRKLHLEITGIDISIEMIKKADAKRARYSSLPHPAPVFVKGCAEKLPFDDHSFDAVTIAFGVRNFENRYDAFQQIYRVLRPNGHLFVLDFATPRNPIWKLFFNAYFSYMLPLWGKMISGNQNAYRYLPRSVGLFPQYEAFCQELSEASFSEITYRAYTGGVAVLYEGRKK